MCVYESRKLEIDPVFVWIAGDSVGAQRRSVVADSHKALAWLEKAAQQGYAPSQAALVVLNAAGWPDRYPAISNPGPQAQ